MVTIGCVEQNSEGVQGYTEKGNRCFVVLLYYCFEWLLQQKGLGPNMNNHGGPTIYFRLELP